MYIRSEDRYTHCGACTDERSYSTVSTICLAWLSHARPDIASVQAHNTPTSLEKEEMGLSTVCDGT